MTALTSSGQCSVTSDKSKQRTIRLTSRPTEPAASIVVATLAAAGIDAVLSGQFTSGFKAEAPGWVSVHVFEYDEARAREVLAELEDNDGGDVDWSQVDVGRPIDGV